MTLLRKIFSINTFILLFACIFLFLSVGQVVEALYDKKKLQVHTGTLVEKEIKVDKDDDKERKFIVLTLSDQKQYIVSKSIDYIFNNLVIGDTVKLFTKPTIGLFSNFVSSETGDKIWTTNNPNEVYELIGCKDNSTLIDFGQHKENLKTMLWGFPLASLCFFGWFFYRRSGRKSPFIIETHK